MRRFIPLTKFPGFTEKNKIAERISSLKNQAQSWKIRAHCLFPVLSLQRNEVTCASLVSTSRPLWMLGSSPQGHACKPKQTPSIRVWLLFLSIFYRSFLPELFEKNKILGQSSTGAKMTRGVGASCVSTQSLPVSKLCGLAESMGRVSPSHRPRALILVVISSSIDPFILSQDYQ